MLEIYRVWLRVRPRLKLAADDDRGVTALEYGLIAALIAVVIITGVTALGVKVNGSFSTIASVMPKG